MLDGKDGELKEYTDVRPFSFSPDGKRLAYSARKGRGDCVVLDGNEVLQSENGFDLARMLLFSPDSRHLAFVAIKSGADRVFLDGVEQGGFSAQKMDRVPQLAFSQDGKHLA